MPSFSSKRHRRIPPPGKRPAVPVATTNDDGGRPDGVSTNSALLRPTASAAVRGSGPIVGIFETTAGLILALAFAIRAVNLGAQPLQSDEAGIALQAWLAIRGEYPGLATDPALLSGTWLAFLLFGASDTAARLAPLAAGMLVVAMPLLVRARLGNVATLFSMLFLATSPTLVYYSRHADGAILAAAFSLAAVTVGYRCWQTRGRRFAVALGICLGTLVLAGSVAYYSLAVISAYSLIAWMASRSRRYAVLAPWFPAPEAETGQEDGEVHLAQKRSPARAALIAAGVTVGVVSTAYLTNPSGIQGCLEGLGLWLTGLTMPSTTPPLVFVIGLVGYEPLLLLLALQGGLTAFARRSPIGLVMSWWAVGLFVVASIGSERPIAVMAQLVVPMALLAGVAADGIVSAIDWRREARRFAYFAIGSLILLCNLMIATNHVSTPDPVVPEALALVSLAVVVLGGVGAVSFLGRSTVARYFSVVVVAACLLFSIHTSTLLSHGDPSGAPAGLADETTNPAVRQLGRDVGDIVDGLALERRPYDVSLDPTLGAPLRWYLRDDTVAGPAPADAARPSISVAPTNAKPPRGAYAGQRYIVAEIPAPPPVTWKGIWRWFVFKEGAGAPSAVEAMVYVRTYPERR
jgi:uncharacterized protein (TIGR03663 family)